MAAKTQVHGDKIYTFIILIIAYPYSFPCIYIIHFHVYILKKKIELRESLIHQTTQSKYSIFIIFNED